jgi:hypothetical protein
MNTIRTAAIGAVLMAAAAGPACAQTIHAGTASTSNQTSVNSQTARNRNQAPAYHVLGVPVVISAPVTAPYGDAYGTYAGQPAYGPNALLSASVAGVP